VSTSTPEAPHRSAFRFSIRTKLLVGFGVPLVLLLVTLITAYVSQRRLAESRKWVEHTYQVLDHEQLFMARIFESSSMARGYALTGASQFQPPYRAAVTAALQEIETLRRLTRDNPREQARLEELNAQARVRIELSERVQDLYQRGNYSRQQMSSLITAGGSATERLRVIVSEIDTEERRLLAARLEALDTSTRLTERVIVLGGATSALAALLAGVLIGGDLARSIRRLVEAAQRLQAGELSYRADLRASDETRTLAEAFNRMATQLEANQRIVQEKSAALDRLNLDLEKRNAALREANAELEAFTYSVSHDLRAPLRHIHGFAAILEDEAGAALNDSARSALARIQQGAKHMGQLVDDLLNLSRIGRKPLAPQVAGLRTIVDKVIANLRQEVDSNGRPIEWRIGELPFIECDPGLMEQAFANLLSNAVKYTRPRSSAVIEVGQQLGDGIGPPVIFVRDNGVGFSMKYAEKLFGIFQRLHRQEDFEGTGVGLATVQRIIRKHNGRIWAEAELDRGACFRFTLGELAPETNGHGKGATNVHE